MNGPLKEKESIPDLRGLRMGDWMAVYNRDGSQITYGKIITADPQRHTAVVERPSKYTLTHGGYIKLPTTVRVRLDLFNTVLYDMTEAEVMGALPMNPFVEMLNEDATIIGGPSSAVTGRIRNVYPNNLILKPYLESPDAVSNVYRAVSHELNLPLGPAMYPKPLEMSLDKLITTLNKTLENKRK